LDIVTIKAFIQSIFSQLQRRDLQLDLQIAIEMADLLNKDGFYQENMGGICIEETAKALSRQFRTFN
jgi:hypothetical protein